MSIRENKFSNIENYFGQLKTSTDSSITNKMTSELSAIYKKSFKINIIKSGERKNLFVMSVIPETSTLDKITMSIMNKKTTLQTITDLWTKCNKWTIEIDQNILTSQFTDRELTALLLHEIGHVMSSNAIPMRIKNVMQYTIMSAYSHLNPMLSDKLFNKILKLPIINSCTFCNSRSDLKEEIKADKFSAKCGYTGDLLSAIDKLTSLQKSNSSITKGFTKDSEMERSTINTLNLVNDLNARKISLAKRNIHDLERYLPESRMKEELVDFDNSLFEERGSTWDHRKEEFIDKRITDDNVKYYTEAFGIFKKKLQPILPNELDYIDLKIQDIKSMNDKMMLMSYTNSKLDLCNWYLGLLDNPSEGKKYVVPHDRATLMRYKARLEYSKNMILNAKIPNLDKERLVVFYPPGYEG